MKKWKRRGWLLLAGMIMAVSFLLFATQVPAEAKVARTSIVKADGKLAKGFSVGVDRRSYPYQGGLRVVPAVTVKYGKTTLVEGKDYKFWTKNAKKVGTATLAVKGLGRYKGTYRTTYQIVRRNAESVYARTRYKTYTYTGKARKPAVLVSFKVGGEIVRLEKGRDYTLSYKDNVGPGTGKVLVKYKGGYTGTTTLTFEIKKAVIPTPSPKPTPTPTLPPVVVPVSEVERDGEHLTAAWYASLLEKGNFVFSPYSLKDCASILYPAAGGTSKTEMEEVIGMSNALTKALRKSDADAIFESGIGFKSANKAYINTLDAAMKNANLDVLDTDQVDLREFDNTTYKDINKYVADATENKIPNLLSADDVNASTASVLLNCIYFLNTWQHEEGKIRWNGSKEVDSFCDEASLKNIKEDGGIDILRLPYSNIPKGGSRAVAGMDTYAMYLICDSVDTRNVGVDAYMAGLTEKQLEKLVDFSGYKGLSGYDEAYFNVPVFETRTRTSLKNLLASLGATDIFSPGLADFRKFADIYIDEILQEAYIKTTAQGTEAAAATAIISKATSAYNPNPPKVKRVIADSTFAFVLKDDTTGQILFVGRISKP